LTKGIGGLKEIKEYGQNLKNDLIKAGSTELEFLSSHYDV
jgi:hypothetical protein